MQQIRIIIAGATLLLADLIEDAVAEHAHIALLKKLDETSDVARYVEQLDANVVILRLAAERLKEFCIPLLKRFPHLLVVSLSDNDRLLLHCELHPRVLECGEASIESLLGYVQAHAPPMAPEASPPGP